MSLERLNPQGNTKPISRISNVLSVLTLGFYSKYQNESYERYKEGIRKSEECIKNSETALAESQNTLNRCKNV